MIDVGSQLNTSVTGMTSNDEALKNVTEKNNAIYVEFKHPDVSIILCTSVHLLFHFRFQKFATLIA